MNKRLREEKRADRWALVCRGLTGRGAVKSSLDDLNKGLQATGCNGVLFDYRYSLDPLVGERLRTTKSMVRDTSNAIARNTKRHGRLPDVVIARGTAARVVLEVLADYPTITLVMWAPILWLRTSLELRYRLHEIRRTGHATFDNTTIGSKFVAVLRDPTDGEIKSYVKRQRRHIIVQPKDDKVSPLRLAEEAKDLIKAANGNVELIVVPGKHPHPGKNVQNQIKTIVRVVSHLG